MTGQCQAALRSQMRAETMNNQAGMALLCVR
jgi:hypothetical protein